MTLCDAACASTFSNHDRLPVYYDDPKHDDKKETNQGGNIHLSYKFHYYVCTNNVGQFAYCKTV